MFTLIMIVTMLNGNASTVGPLAIDDFKTEQECIAFAKEYTRNLLKRFNRFAVDTENHADHFICIDNGN